MKNESYPYSNQILREQGPGLMFLITTLFVGAVLGIIAWETGKWLLGILVRMLG